MTKNMGSLDRVLRLIVAAILAFLIFNGTLAGTMAIIAGVVAVIFTLTSLVGTCPLYKPLGINTCGKG